MARPGDLIFVDWDPDGKADGELDHTMIVTGIAITRKLAMKTPINGAAQVPTISQKTKNRHNIPLFESIEIARTQGKKLENTKWFALTPQQL
jgi:hypothetical protein